jgi:hypothetical protein
VKNSPKKAEKVQEQVAARVADWNGEDDYDDEDDEDNQEIGI